jgi:multimeric flavodoxin WrbA
MAKTVLILKGSPRRNGNSAALADRAAEGAREAGAVVEETLLDRMKIRPCNACDQCRKKGGCVIQDDMQALYPKLLAADAILIATPVYYFTMSAQVKACIDRWYALEGTGGNAIKGKQVGILMSYGDSDLQTSGGINAVRTFESIFGYIGCEIVGMVHGSASDPGDIQGQSAVMEQAYALGKQIAG